MIPASLMKYDLNHDGVINAKDCPYKFGSPEAKTWWKNVMEPASKAGITTAMRDKYGDKVVGTFNNKPLVPGLAGKNQSDMSFLITKLQVVNGLSPGAAVVIARKAALQKYKIKY